MVNSLHALLHSPHAGWDPIVTRHAEEYAQRAIQDVDSSLVDELERRLGGFAGKEILDLGGGPGQYSVAFARRGAHVTWHDISRNYRRIAAGHAARNSVDLRFSIGYLEEAIRTGPFDFVFCRVCWSYARNDRAFASTVYSLVRPGGAGYVECDTPGPAGLSRRRRLQYTLNRFFGWKIGHPYPPQGRIASLIQAHSIDYLTVDYQTRFRDKVFFVRSRS